MDLNTDSEFDTNPLWQVICLSILTDFWKYNSFG